MSFKFIFRIFVTSHIPFREKTKNFTESLKRKEKNPPKQCDQEYYNDLPGKVPPDVITNTKISKSPKVEKRRERISSNLIDLDTPIHEYVNEKVMEDDLFAPSSKEIYSNEVD